MQGGLPALQAVGQGVFAKGCVLPGKEVYRVGGYLAALGLEFRNGPWHMPGRGYQQPALVAAAWAQQLGHVAGVFAGVARAAFQAYLAHVQYPSGEPALS